MTDSTARRVDAGILATRLWHRLRRPLTRHRAIYMWLSRRRTSRASLLVRSDSVLVVEAPMRSANTYAVAAFHLSNGRSGHVARHMHTPAHVLEAVRLEIPTVVIVREPKALAISHVIRRPALTVRDSLIDYVDFFETLDSVRSDLVVATFEEITHNFDLVIQRINDQYGTDFKAPRLDAAFDRQVKELVEDMNRAEKASGGEVDERRVARPSIDRTQLRLIPEQQLEDRRVQPYLKRAKATYERWR